MTAFDRLIARAVEPGLVLRGAALAVVVMELAASVGALLGFRTEPYDGLAAAVYRRMGGAPDDKALLLIGIVLLLGFALLAWRLARVGPSALRPGELLLRLLLIDALAFSVTPGLPFVVTALAAVLLPARRALLFVFGQVLINLAVYAALPGAELLPTNAELPAWLDLLGLVLAMLALHGMAFGLGRMAAAEAEKRRWLQVMLAERLSAEQWQAEQLRLNERLQIARELHDLMGHHLTALNLQLQLGTALLARTDPAGAAQAVDKARLVAANLLEDVRAAVSEQRATQRIDLSAALHALADGVSSGVAGTRIELALDDSVRDLGPRAAHALLRSVQEAVTNSVRHAGASRVAITLAALGERGEDVAVTIDDDGRGAPRLNPGNGLKGMSERMAELGGEMLVARHRPGFRIELRCPRAN
jgi:signal transduction histidine kinase